MSKNERKRQNKLKQQGQQSTQQSTQQQGQQQKFDEPIKNFISIYTELKNIPSIENLDVINLQNSGKNKLLYAIFYANNYKNKENKQFRNMNHEERIKLIINIRENELKIKNEINLNDLQLIENFLQIRIIVLNLKENSNFTDKDFEYDSKNGTILLLFDKKDLYRCFINKNKGSGILKGDTIDKIVKYLKDTKPVLFDSSTNHEIHFNNPGTQTPGNKSTQQGLTLPSIGTGQRGTLFHVTRDTKTGLHTAHGMTVGNNTSEGRTHAYNIARLAHPDYDYNFSNNYGRNKNYVAPRAKENSQVLLLILVPITLIFLLFVLGNAA